MKKTNIVRYIRCTGGGKSTKEVLTPMEESVLELITPTQVECDSEIDESQADFKYDFEAVGTDIEIIYENPGAISTPNGSLTVSSAVWQHPFYLQKCPKLQLMLLNHRRKLKSKSQPLHLLRSCWRREKWFQQELPTAREKRGTLLLGG